MERLQTPIFATNDKYLTSLLSAHARSLRHTRIVLMFHYGDMYQSTRDRAIEENLQAIKLLADDEQQLFWHLCHPTNKTMTEDLFEAIMRLQFETTLERLYSLAKFLCLEVHDDPQGFAIHSKTDCLCIMPNQQELGVALKNMIM